MRVARDLRRLVYGLLLPVVCMGVPPENVTTHHYDNFRTGWNPQETILTPTNVSQNSFGLIANVPVGDQVDAQPLVLSNVKIGSTTYPTVVYVATESNTVYAINGQTGAVLASKQLEAAAPISQILDGSCTNNGPNIGINSTPVIDAASNWLYVVTATIQSSRLTYHLHQLSVTTLTDNPATVLTLTPPPDTPLNRQRSALTLYNGGVLIPFTSFCDSTNTLGFIIYANVNTAPGEQTAFGTSIYWLASIWMSGSGPAVSGNNIYFATGNGKNEGQMGPPDTNMPDSMVSLLGSSSSGSLGLSLNAFQTPDTSIIGQDYDYGAGGVVIVPSGSPTSITSSTPAQFVAGAGKKGVLYVFKPALGIGSEVQGVSIGGDCHCGTSYFTGPSGVEYVVTAAGTTLGLYSVSSSGLTEVTSTQLPAKAYGEPGFFTSVSSNGTTSGSGIIWAVSGPDSCYAMTLYAFNALTLAPLFSGPVGTWTNVGGNANIVPVVANGHVYVATNGELSIWGTGTPPPPSSISANFNQDCPLALVSWNPSSGATSYKMYMTSGHPPAWCPLSAGLAYSGSATSTKVHVNQGLSYAFGVAACNTVGCSVQTGPARGSPPNQCP